MVEDKYFDNAIEAERYLMKLGNKYGWARLIAHPAINKGVYIFQYVRHKYKAGGIQ